MISIRASGAAMLPGLRVVYSGGLPSYCGPVNPDRRAGYLGEASSSLNCPVSAPGAGWGFLGRGRR